MTKKPPEAAPKDQWTLIRRVRQLITLRGPSGPRRGSAFNQLNIVKDGALLLHNGVIQEAGAARRVENLRQAKNAREIDAGGRVVMPAFVDPDAVLVYPPTKSKGSSGAVKGPPSATGARLGVVSKHRLALTGAASAADWVRAGVLSVGAHTGYASNLRDTLRILRIHHTLQAKPLRIRSIYSPSMEAGEPATSEAGRALLELLEGRALPYIRRRKLAAIIELPLDVASPDFGVARQVAISAAEHGFAIRIRVHGIPAGESLDLCLGASSIAFIAAPVEPTANLLKLATIGCVHVLQATAAIREGWNGAGTVRREIDEGIPMAIASGFRAGSVTSQNPQFLLHLAVERFGMTPEEAIVASTYNAACSLRMSHVTGSLEPGKAGDLLVMDVTDYRDLIHRVGHNDVQLAMRSGSVVYRRGALTLD